LPAPMVTAKLAATRGDPRTRIENRGLPPDVPIPLHLLPRFQRPAPRKADPLLYGSRSTVSRGVRLELQNFARPIAVRCWDARRQRVDRGDEGVRLSQRCTGEAVVEL